MHCLGLDLAEQHQVADHHQPLDVVVVAQAIQPLDRLIQGRQAGAALAPAWCQLALVLPEVATGLAVAVQTINAAHKFAPADHLAQEPLQRSDRHLLATGLLPAAMLKTGLDHRSWTKQTDIE